MMSLEERSNSLRSSSERFEAKRLAVERRAGLRRLWLVLGLTFITSTGVGIIGFVNSTWFDVDEISVVGASRSQPALIVSASDIEVGQGLLDVDAQAAAAQIELVPWIGTATVKRSWTGQILITVVERPPSAALPAGPRFALVDDHGRQLEIVDERPDGYLPIRGIEGSGVAGEPAPDEALPIIALLDALPPSVEEQVSGVLVEDRHLFLELTAGGLVDFGDGSQLAQKIQSLETMLARVDLRCLNTIDVRVPAAPVVTRDQPAETGQADANPSRDQETTQSEPLEEPDSWPGDC